MGNSIEDLKSTIGKHGGIAVSNRFRIIFTPPTQSLFNLDVGNLIGNLISGSLSAKSFINDPRDISLLCQSASLPSRQITTQDFQNHLTAKKHPYALTDEEVATTFLLTNDMYIKHMFDNWQESIFNAETHYASYREDFVTDVTIQQLNKENKPMYGIKLVNAFPTTLGSVGLSNVTAGEPLNYSVTWSYDYWVAENALTSTLSGGLRAVKNLLS